MNMTRETTTLVPTDKLKEMQLAIARLERELEFERGRLAACGVAALGYLEGCADEFKSASLDDVLRVRAENEKLLQDVERMTTTNRVWLARWNEDQETINKLRTENEKLLQDVERFLVAQLRRPASIFEHLGVSYVSSEIGPSMKGE